MCLGNFPLREISWKTARHRLRTHRVHKWAFLCPIHKDTKISWHFQGVNSHLHFGAWPFRGLTFILHLIGWRGGSTLTSSVLPTYPLFSLSLSIKDSALRAAWKTLRGFLKHLVATKGHKFRIHGISTHAEELQHAITRCLGKSSGLCGATAADTQPHNAVRSGGCWQ